MQEPVLWQSCIDNQLVSFQYEVRRGRPILAVDNERHEFKRGFLDVLTGSVDRPFPFRASEARLVVHGQQPDVALRGTLLRSGQPYSKRPAWAAVFVVLCGLISVVSLGKAFAVFLGLGGAWLCLRTATSILSPSARFIICLTLTILDWLLFLLLIAGFGTLPSTL